MSWLDWTIIAILGLSAITNVAIVGKARKPVTPGIAAINVLLTGLLIAGIVYFRGG